MSFELIEPGTFVSHPPIDEDQASISKGGTITVRAEALAAVGIEHYAIVLVDKGSLRVAMRNPRDAGERARSFAVSPGGNDKNRDHGRRRINAARALKSLGLDLPTVAGRYTLATKDDLLIVNLQQPRAVLERLPKGSEREPGVNRSRSEEVERLKKADVARRARAEREPADDPDVRDVNDEP